MPARSHTITRLASRPLMRRVAVIAAAGLLAETALAASASPVVAVQAPPQAAAVAPAAGEGSLYAPDTASAALTAQLRGRSVEVVGLRTEASSTWANPDGSFTTDTASAPVRVKRGEGWVQIDPSLQRSGEFYRPKATAAELAFTAGGSSELASLGTKATNGKQVGVKLHWASRLPVPVVDERASNTLTYPEVTPGADLVVTAGRTGFSHSLVLKSRAAAAVIPARLRLPLGLTGLTPNITPTGGIQLLDAVGEVVFDAPAPQMWDARVNPATGDPAAVRAVKAQIDTTGPSPVLVLTPDVGFLADATTVYPVTIDPTFTQDAADTWIQDDDYPTSQHSSTELRVGTYDRVHVARSFLRFDTAALAGKKITDAKLKLDNYYSGSCEGRPIEAHRLTEAYDYATLSWSNQPTSTSTGKASLTTPYGYSSACPAGTASWEVDAITQAWADGAPSHGVMLRAADETSIYTWRRYRSANYSTADDPIEPHLVVTYNSYPAVPEASWTPRSNYTEGTTPNAFSTTTTPQLWARVTDPDGGVVKGVFDVYDGTTPVITGLVGTTVTSGAQSTATVPAGRLVAGRAYTVKAWASDGTLTSKTSFSPRAMNVDTTNPAKPGVSSADYPADGKWYRGAGQAGRFSLTAAETGYLTWWLDDGVRTTKTATGGAAQTISVTPTTDGTHVLYVQGKDKAGRASGVVEHAFNVGAGVVTSPGEGEETARRFLLGAKGRAEFTHVTFEYRRSPVDPWTRIPDGPAGHVSQPDGTKVTWPLPTIGVPDGTTVSDIVENLGWDAVATLAGGNGLMDVRARFTGPTTSSTAPVSVTVDQQASSAATHEIGPGEVNLLTGDYRLADDDGAFGMSVSRTASSRDPERGSKIEGLVAPFGPQWAVGGIDEGIGASFQAVRKTSSTTAEVLFSEGTAMQFAKTGAKSWKAEPGEEELTLAGDGTTDGPFVLTDTDGAETRFATGAGPLYPAATTTPAASTSNTTTRHVFESVTVGGVTKLRLKRLIAPTSAVPILGDCDVAIPPAGCRVLDLVYTPDTAVIPGAGAFGVFPGRAEKLLLHAAAPAGSTTSAVTLATYRYDGSGRLRQVTDPRAPGLSGGYEYDAAGRVTKLLSAGEEPWMVTYGSAGSGGDPNAGRLLKVTSATLAPGTAGTINGAASTSVVYDVPRTLSAGGPQDMTGATTQSWGQTGRQVPTDATAIFPPDQVPSSHTGSQQSWTRANVVYLDATAEPVNTLTPGGHLTYSAHDEHGNTLSELTAANRALALNPDDPELVSLGIAGLASPERAELLSSVSVYSSDGLRELEEYGALHLLSVAGGAPEPGRGHTVNTYDEGRPADAVASDLVTASQAGARLLNASSDVDTRTVRTEYDWLLGEPVKVTSGPAGSSVSYGTVYDGQGRTVKSVMPKSSGSDAGTTITTYYTPGPHPTVAECGNRREWADMLCRIAPAADITGAPTGQPVKLPTTTITYTQLGDSDITTATSAEGTGASTTRITDTDYDAAGRPIRTATTGAVGKDVPVITVGYSSDTGAQASVTATDAAGSSTTGRSYDRLGRFIAYTDAGGATSRTQYDSLNRPTKSTGGDGSTTTFAYDHAVEPRGLLTGIIDSVAGTFSGRYDPDGALTEQTLPGGITMAEGENTAGARTGRTWTKRNPDTTTTTLLDEQVTMSVHGQWLSHAGRSSSQNYRYDALGRVQQVEDTVQGACSTRAYAYDANSNRTHLEQAAAGAGAACPAAPALGAADRSYDSADRLVNPGYSYDAFGRTTTKPGIAAVDYYVDDLVREVRETADKKQTWALDPELRLRSTSITTKNPVSGLPETVTKVNHYADDSDSPAWTTEGDGTITRNVIGMDGVLAATTTSTGGTRLQLTNLHGDVVLDIDPAAASPDADRVYDADEFGNPRGGESAARYGWLGGHLRSSEAPAGLVLMGVRLYDPAEGRFLQVDPIAGASANAYDYAYQDPINIFDLDGRCPLCVAVGVAAARAAIARGAAAAAAAIAKRAAMRAAAERHLSLAAKRKAGKAAANRAAARARDEAREHHKIQVHRNSSRYRGTVWGYTIHYQSRSGRWHIWKYGISVYKHSRAQRQLSQCRRMMGGACSHRRYSKVKFQNRRKALAWEQARVGSYRFRYGHCPPGQWTSCR